jgi:hypothetical protein
VKRVEEVFHIPDGQPPKRDLVIKMDPIKIPWQCRRQNLHLRAEASGMALDRSDAGDPAIALAKE